MAAIPRGKAFGGSQFRPRIPRLTRLPWIPSHEEWQAILAVVRTKPLRNRLMLAFAYDAALRREELCSPRTDDLDPTHRTLRIRAETTKGRRKRIVPYSASTGVLLQHYPLTEDEQAAVEEGAAAVERLLERLADRPTPAGDAPRQLEYLPMLRRDTDGLPDEHTEGALAQVGGGVDEGNNQPSCCAGLLEVRGQT